MRLSSSVNIKEVRAILIFLKKKRPKISKFVVQKRQKMSSKKTKMKKFVVQNRQKKGSKLRKMVQ